MSWKGTKKTFERLPQNLRVKTGLGSATRDIQFDDVLNRFNELHTGTEKLYKDAVKFRDGVSHLLNHQYNISDLLVELYNPIVGKKETESTVRRTTTPVQSMRAIEEFKKTMSDLREILLPELDRVDELVVLPSKDFIDIVKMIKKTITKRDHKKVDFDRYTTSVNKLQGKNERSANDEKSLIKAEENLTKATEEYEHYNNLLKKELPAFFEYRAQFIEPVVTNFYRLQVKIYQIIFEKTEHLISNTPGYFDVQSDILTHYNERRVEVDHQIDTHLTLLKNKKKSKKESSSSSIHHNNDNGEVTSSKYSNITNHGDVEDAPPPYSSTVGSSSAISSSNPKLYPVQKNIPPPVPPYGKSVQYVRALYDFDAQAAGDLSFKKGDKIEVINRTGDVNEWWKGKLNGKVGDFPGNYVEDW